MARILVLEDDKIASKILKQRLEFEGYLVDCVADSMEALYMCDENLYDLLILDITIHGSMVDGVEVAEKVMEKHSVPFIFLTSSTSEESHMRGLGVGAMAYMTKPISYKILVLQVKNILRKGFGERRKVYKGHSIDIERNMLTKTDGTVIKMSQKPIMCLAYLIKHKGKVVSKKELSDNIWRGDVPVTDDVINSTINRIREYIGDSIIITTHRGQGYEIEE